MSKGSNAGPETPHSYGRLSKARLTTPKCLALMSAHLLVGFISSDSGTLISVHAAVTTAVVLWLAASTSNIGVVLTCATYAAASEVFWRLPDSRVPWMWGTYLATVVLLIGWYRLIRSRADLVPLAFLVCLIPGAALTVLSVDVGTARDRLAFNVAGSLLLVISVITCSRVRSTREGLDHLLWWLVAAVLLVSGAAIAGEARVSALDFTGESNFATSAGFGPNQVSLTLGVGAVAALLLLLGIRRARQGVLPLTVLVLLLVQGVLTFSRTGPFLAVVAAVAALVGGSRSAPRVVLNLARGMIVVVILILVIGPWIESFTGGQASQRFGSAQTSHRDEIADADLAIFADFPVLGTGVGGSPDARALLGLRGSPSHTEQTRLLAEHGVFGLTALVLIVAMAVQAVRRQAFPAGRGWAACWVVWSFAAMSVAANRVGIVPLTFGLGFILLQPPRKLDPEPDEHRSGGQRWTRASGSDTAGLPT